MWICSNTSRNNLLLEEEHSEFLENFTFGICEHLLLTEDQPEVIDGRRLQNSADSFWSSRLLFSPHGHVHNILVYDWWKTRSGFIVRGPRSSAAPWHAAEGATHLRELTVHPPTGVPPHWRGHPSHCLSQGSRGRHPAVVRMVADITREWPEDRNGCIES